jgi:hypothetical protein
VNNVPTWILLWAAGQTGCGILFLLLRSVKRGQTIYSSPHLPGNPGPTFIEQDHMDRFVESRFDV